MRKSIINPITSIEFFGIFTNQISTAVSLSLIEGSMILIAIVIDSFSFSAWEIVFEATQILYWPWGIKYTITLSLAFYKLALITISTFPEIFSRALREVIYKVTFVVVSVLKFLFSKSISFWIHKFSFINRNLIFKDSFSIECTLFPFTEITPCLWKFKIPISRSQTFFTMTFIVLSIFISTFTIPML